MTDAPPQPAQTHLDRLRDAHEEIREVAKRQREQSRAQLDRIDRAKQDNARMFRYAHERRS